MSAVLISRPLFIFQLQKIPVEFFGVPVNDEILLQARADLVLGICKPFVTDEIYEGHFRRFTNSIETNQQVLKSFFEVLAGLGSAAQEECFEAIVNQLSRSTGFTHVVERLQTGKQRSLLLFNIYKTHYQRWEWRGAKTLLGSRDGAVVRALAFHRCGSYSIPGLDVIRGLSLSLVPVFAPRRFFSGYSGFPGSSKTNTSKFQFDLESVPN